VVIATARIGGQALTLLLLVLDAALLAQESAPATQPAETRPAATLSRADMEADLALLEKEIRANWSYLEDKEQNFGVDLGALMAAAKKRLPETGTKAEFHAIVLELVAGLKDGHANVFTLGVAEPRRRWPFRVEEVAEGFVVVESSKDWAVAGERLIEVSGPPPDYRQVKIEDAIASLMRTTIASTELARKRAALRRLHQTDLKLVTVGFVRVDGTRHWVSFEPEPKSEKDGDPPAFPSWRPAVVAPGVVRIRVATFMVEDWPNWLKAAPESREPFLTKTKESIDRCFGEIAKLPEADRRALILDLRGNGGGTDQLGIHLARYLLPKRFVYFRLSSKLDGTWTRPHGYEHDPVPPGERFDGPLAILIDERCFSVTDNLLRAIVENRDDVITVGRPTNGGTGAPRAFAKLPRSETWVTLCTQRVSGPAGVITEGRGTVPTVAVEWTAADFLERRDPDLAAAIAALTRAESRPK
jgi:hypothetical protein